MINSLKLLLVELFDTLGARVLLSLGIGFISFAGYSALIDTLISTAQANWSGMGSDSLALLSLAGFPSGFGIILGAVVARASLSQISKLGKLSPK